MNYLLDEIDYTFFLITNEGSVICNSETMDGTEYIYYLYFVFFLNIFLLVIRE